ncbi:MAG: serine hydrolase domain-containing protein [Candidatus Hermodarchaeota archaeon]
MKLRCNWKKTTLMVVILLMFTSAFLMTDIVKGQVKTATYWPTNEWNVTDPSDQDMDNETIYKMYDYMVDFNINLHSVSIVRNGFLVHEEYISRYMLREEKSYGLEPDYWGIDVVINGTLHAQFSATKTIIALLIGIAIDKEFIDNVNQTFASFFPTLTYNAPSKEDITIEHLLTMTSGIYGDTDPEFGGDKTIQQILNPTLYSTPGTTFRYSSYSTNLLSAIINKSTGQKTSEFAKEYLFDPIGITQEDFYWLENSEGINTGGYGLYFTPQAMARIGLLMLNDGMWNDTQVISKNWMLKVGTPQPNGFYGYLVWMDKYSYHAAGFLGQLIFRIPAYNMTVVFTAASNDVTETYIYMIDNFIIAAINKVPPSNPAIPGYSLAVFLPLMIFSVGLISKKIKKAI